MRTSAVVRAHALFLSASAASLALASPAAAQERSQVIVRARANDGQPVLDLKPADVSLRIDGRQRQIVSLEPVRPVTAAAASRASAAMAPPYTTNAAAPAMSGAREFMIAIDDEGIAPGREQPVRAAVTA